MPNNGWQTIEELLLRINKIPGGHLMRVTGDFGLCLVVECVKNT
jgi:hypothetical protein